MRQQKAAHEVSNTARCVRGHEPAVHPVNAMPEQAQPGKYTIILADVRRELFIDDLAGHQGQMLSFELLADGQR
jgi:hypothetical protein